MTNFLYKGAFWLSVVKTKPEINGQSEEWKVPSRANKISKKKKTTQMPKAREKASDHVVIGLSFAARVFWTNDRAK